MKTTIRELIFHRWVLTIIISCILINNKIVFGEASSQFQKHNANLAQVSPYVVQAKAVNTVYYVSIDGNDDNIGTYENPFATIQHAYDVASSGDVVMVMDGTYYPPSTFVLQTRKNGITFRSQNKHGAILNSNGQTLYVVEIESDSITIDGFQITGAIHHGIVVYGSNNKILNCEIHHNGNTQIGSGIYSSYDNPIKKNVYAYNYIHDNGRPGTNLYDHGLYLCEDSIEIYNNILTHHSGWGIQLTSGNIQFGVKVYNNVCAWNRQGGLIMLDDIRGAEIINNIFYKNDYKGINCWGLSGTNIVISNNLFYENSSNYDTECNICSFSDNIFEIDPEFIDEESDFHLLESSPAIDAGKDVGLPFWDSFPDIGAFEFEDSTVQNNPPVADAGPDQNIIDYDNSGNENVSLNGAGSNDSDGSIISYIWREESNQVATGVNPIINLSVGIHNITLIVTDNRGETNSDITIITVIPDTIPPTAPQNLIGSPVSATHVDLAWDAATDNVEIAGYFIHRNDVRIDSTTELNYSDLNAPSSSQSEYTVSAYDHAHNEGNMSNRIIITTFINPDTEPPSMPTNLRSTEITSTTIGLEWSASSDNIGVVEYNIYRNGIYLDATTELNYTDTNLQPETEYIYSISALDQAGNESEMSDEVIVSTQEAVNVIYINPESSNPLTPDGSIEAPYKSWNQVTWREGYKYMQLRNTTSYEPKILITANNVVLGTYGSGERPKIITTATDYAISTFEKSKVIISDLEILAENSIGGIYFAGPLSDSILIEKCKISGGEYSIRIIGGNNFVIRYNELNAELNAIYSIATNSKIYYNEIVGSEVAINISDYSSKAEIYNNIFFSNLNAISSSYGDLTLYNNIFSLDIPGSMAINQLLDSIVSDNNIFYPIRPSFIKIGNNTYDNLLSYQSDKYVDLNSVSEDPLFENPDFNDFRIKEESPAIEAGINVGIPIDKFGVEVPYGNFPDIGVHEAEILISSLNEDKSDGANINIFPNPSNGKFSVQILDENISAPVSVWIFDILGDLIYTKHSLNSNIHTFNFENLMPGQYMIVLNFNDRIVNKTFYVIQ